MRILFCRMVGQSSWIRSSAARAVEPVYGSVRTWPPWLAWPPTVRISPIFSNKPRICMICASVPRIISCRLRPTLKLRQGGSNRGLLCGAGQRDQTVRLRVDHQVGVGQDCVDHRHHRLRVGARDRVDFDLRRPGN